MDDCPDYRHGFINALRPPEVEGEVGSWTSRWLLKTNRPITQSQLSQAAESSSREDVLVRLSDLGGGRLRLEIDSPRHALDVEAYPEVDHVLRTLDEALGGILEINDSPRDWWRPFRMRRGSHGYGSG